jgi:Rieske Fe-S protein
MKLPRREFLSRCLTAALAAGARTALPASLWTARTATAAQPLAGDLIIRLSDYPELQQLFGSVKVSVPDARPPVPQRIIVTRTGATEFAAVDDICTHAGCLVNTYRRELGGLPCPCHGALYAPTGEVLRGPAPRPLNRFPAALEDEQTLRIQLPSEVLEPAPAQLLHAITPNPAGEWIAISGTLPNAGIARFRIFSASGKLLLEWQQYLPEGPFALRYPLAGIAPGAYWLELLPPGHPPLQRPFTVVR